MEGRCPHISPSSSEAADSLEDPTRLLAWVECHAGALCAGCEMPLCGHALLHSRAGAGAVPPRCCPCLAKVLRLDPGTLAENLSALLGKKSNNKSRIAPSPFLLNPPPATILTNQPVPPPTIRNGMPGIWVAAIFCFRCAAG